MEEQHLYLHALRSLPSIGDKSLRKIIGAFNNDARLAWESRALPDSLPLGRVLKNVWSDRHILIPDVHTNALILKEQGIRIITETDHNYPALLKEAPDHPYFLYVRGALPSLTLPLLAVVGARKYTTYGKQACESLVRDVSRAGIGIISGLAFGIDKIAHETALNENGYTLAVLGSGVDDESITPRSNQAVAKRLLQTGALVSEFPPGCPASPKNFPMRNRIVAGMALGTLVIEAAEKSGSLITARLALDYDRDVYAVPGSIFSALAVGTNNLIKKGAIPVTHSQDILQTLLPHPVSGQQTLEFSGVPLPALSPLESKLVKILSYEALHIDELVKRADHSIAEVSSVLMMLEIKKLTKHIGNQHYILVPK